MSAAQSALPWGRERRYLGPRQQPGRLFNLISWLIRTTGRCWATWEWFSERLKVSVPTVKRWFSRFAPTWGLKHVQIGARRWQFVRCEVIRDSAQTDPPKEVTTLELEPSTREVSSPLVASVGENESQTPEERNALRVLPAPGPVTCEEPGTDSRPPRAKSAVLATGEFSTTRPEWRDVPGKDTTTYQKRADVVPVGVSPTSAVGWGLESGRQARGSVCSDARNQDRDRIGSNTATSAGWPQRPVRFDPVKPSSPNSQRGPSYATPRSTPPKTDPPIGFPEGVRQMIGICEASGKRLSKPDGQAAAATWFTKGCEPIAGTVVAAYYSACRAASAPRYVPAPGPWLQMEGWTRGEQERVLLKQSKMEGLISAAMDILNLRSKA